MKSSEQIKVARAKSGKYEEWPPIKCDFGQKSDNECRSMRGRIIVQQTNFPSHDILAECDEYDATYASKHQDKIER